MVSLIPAGWPRRPAAAAAAPAAQSESGGSIVPMETAVTVDCHT